MHIAIIATEAQKEILLLKPIPALTQISWVNKFTTILADAYVCLLLDENVFTINSISNKPILVHSLTTLSKELPNNCIRINAWNTFLEKDTIEMSFDTSMNEVVKQIASALGWKYIACADTYGLMGARIISMIINEAYFALSENISTQKEIDLAMRLGTNYPYGPFEWGQKIGLQYVANLLIKMSTENSIYIPSKALIAAANQS
ncbi:MAG: 3-hydroxyacyl-CoA dehydrogenase family protein [Chitinophagaceae bacterium]